MKLLEQGETVGPVEILQQIKVIIQFSLVLVLHLQVLQMLQTMDILMQITLIILTITQIKHNLVLLQSHLLKE